MPLKPVFVEALSQISPAPKVVVEVGAHVGDAVIQYKQLWPNATIVAIEASAENYKQLQKRCGADAECVHAAVGATSGAAQLWWSKDATRQGSLASDVMKYRKSHGKIKSFNSEEVKKLAIADVVGRHAPVDMLRLDCYGGEYGILPEGMVALSKLPWFMWTLHVKPYPFDTKVAKALRKAIIERARQSHSVAAQCGGKRKHLMQLWKRK